MLHLDHLRDRQQALIAREVIQYQLILGQSLLKTGDTIRMQLALGRKLLDLKGPGFYTFFEVLALTGMKRVGSSQFIY